MIDYISLYPNPYESSFNDDVLLGLQDTPLEDFIIMAMRELEAVSNIKIEKIETVRNQDEVDINRHLINVNYKKKDLDSIEIPKFKYTSESRYGEMVFTIRVSTNLHEKVIHKRILFPLEYDGYYYSNGKRMKAIWQIVDASTYSQRGKSTLKSRMPIIIYQNKKREMVDINGEVHISPSYSYALNSKGRNPKAKTKSKFINPIMIYSAKMGFMNTCEFFGMDGIVDVSPTYKEEDLKTNYVFQLNDVYIIVNQDLYNKYELVRSFACMVYNLASKDFPVTWEALEDREYWTCRIGTVGAIKNKSLSTFLEKGITNLYMIERLLDETTINNLRLPEYYKHNIYYLLYWMITNFDALRSRVNIDMRNKRIRKNEYIVNASLGRKINENLNRLIEKRGRSRMNTMDTLLELFNFGSDIIVAGMRNLNDLIKPDDIVNDNDFVLDTAFSMKGPNSLGDGNSKMIAVKYRYLHPSMVGVLDLNTSSNSDIGLSGSIVPSTQLYDKYYFTPEHEPCTARYEFDKSLKTEEKMKNRVLHFSDFNSYIKAIGKSDKFKQYLSYIPITIVEKLSPSEQAEKDKEVNVDA